MNDKDQVIEKMKTFFHMGIQEWLGFDIPSEGEEDYDTWQWKIEEVDSIESFDDVLSYLEEEGRDVADFLICGDWDLSALNLKPEVIPPEVVSELGNEIASVTMKDGAGSKVIEYCDFFLAQNAGGSIVFDNAKEAFRRADIGGSTNNQILNIDVAPNYEDLVGNFD